MRYIIIMFFFILGIYFLVKQPNITIAQVMGVQMLMFAILHKLDKPPVVLLKSDIQELFSNLNKKDENTKTV